MLIVAKRFCSACGAPVPKPQAPRVPSPCPQRLFQSLSKSHVLLLLLLRPDRLRRGHPEVRRVPGLQEPGCNCICFPITTVSSGVAGGKSEPVPFDCKTKDNVTVSVVTAVQYRIQKDMVKAFYIMYI